MDLTTPQILVIGFITGIIIAYAKHSHNLWLEWFGYGCVGLILAYFEVDPKSWAKSEERKALG